MNLFIKNEKDLICFAEDFSKNLKPGQFISLQGEIGVGKTSFVRAVLNALGYKNKVKSPTFTLVETYEFHPEISKIHHFDLYRLNKIEELEVINFREYFSEDSLCFIEWPEKAGTYLPKMMHNIKILKNTGSENDEERIIFCE